MNDRAQEVATKRGLPGMFGSFFDTSAIDAYADEIIEEVKRALPANPDPSMGNVIADKVDRLDKRIAQRTDLFMRKSPKLNIYKKARLASRVQEGMASHGYPKAFIKSFSLNIVNRLAAAVQKR